jgi:BlaI family transcriptional regulator, penicillinase repressor
MPVPQISEAEWDVMKVVWERGPLTSGQIVRHLERDKDWRPRTIKTLLGRLVRKGAVVAKAQDKKFLYTAKVSREAVVRRESRSFLRRVFDGAVTPALVHFLEHAELSEREIKELKAALNREKP